MKLKGDNKLMKKLTTFFITHKSAVISCVCGLAAGAIAAIIVFAAIFFGYFRIAPQDTVNVTITPAEINGTKEDGSAITGFIIEKDEVEYLITDYWNPIQLQETVEK